MSWILTIIKAVLMFFKLIGSDEAKLKQLENRLQEIKNAQAETNNSHLFAVLDAERVQIVQRIANIHRKRKKSYIFTKK